MTRRFRVELDIELSEADLLPAWVESATPPDVEALILARFHLDDRTLYETRVVSVTEHTTNER